MYQKFKYGLPIFLLISSIFIYFLKDIHNNNVYKTYLVIDAGSTGTRLHYFELIRASLNHSKWTISNETIYFVSPGFSSFTENVTKVSESIAKLISKVRHRINEFNVPVYLGATAGLRLLGNEKANILLKEAKSQLMKESKLKLIENGVNLLDGETEGLLAWQGMMHLLNESSADTFNNPSVIGSIDLGGASVQVTLKQYNNRKVFINSFLGLGLKSARLDMLENSLYAPLKSDLESNNVDANGNPVIVSSCLPLGYRGHWMHHSENYTLLGAPSYRSPWFPNKQFLTCYQAANKVIKKHFNSTISKQLRGLYSNQNREEDGDNTKIVQFYLFGYLYDRIKDLHESNMNLSRLQQTSVLNINHYGEYAEYACQNHEDSHSNPFKCADMVYLYTLLKDGLNFTNQIQLHVVKSINGIQLGWPLGILLDILPNQVDQN